MFPMFPSVKVSKRRMKSPLVSRDPRLKKPPTEFELANELDPLGCATDNGRLMAMSVMAISQILYGQYHIWDILGIYLGCIPICVRPSSKSKFGKTTIFILPA